jgi:hypothetical protein
MMKLIRYSICFCLNKKVVNLSCALMKVPGHAQRSGSNILEETQALFAVVLFPPPPQEDKAHGRMNYKDTKP